VRLPSERAEKIAADMLHQSFRSASMFTRRRSFSRPLTPADTGTQFRYGLDVFTRGLSWSRL
jgi:hypothetical protein